MAKDSPSGGSAELTEVSLSQVLLAPLNSLFKAQLHAARSFLNLLLQIGYRHQPLDESGEPRLASAPDQQTPYMLDFVHSISVAGVEHFEKVSIPALALVPMVPLSIESAEFNFSLAVTKCSEHEQMQPAFNRDHGDDSFESNQRPWYLVDRPISIKGIIAKEGSKDSTQAQTTIDIKVKIGKMPVPAALDKLLTTLSQNVITEPLLPKTTSGGSPSEDNLT